MTDSAMRALTLSQPWAWVVVYGGKRIENRPVMPPANLVGHRFAIHAGRKSSYVHTAVDFIRRILGHCPGPDDPEMVYSALIGTAVLKGAVRATNSDLFPPAASQDPWFVGPVGYILDDVRPLARCIPCRGFQGFWPLGELATELAAS